MRVRLWILLAVLLPLLGWGCTLSRLTVHQRMQQGDRQMEWGLVYYRSWLDEESPHYLRLAREYTAEAVQDYFRLQLELGHAYPDFYILDKRRRRGCRFLREIDRTALRHEISLDGAGHEGCLR